MGNNQKTSVVECPPTDYKSSLTFVANTTALKGIFQRLATQFGAMYKRKAFLHWYKGEGMDEMEFQEADKNVRDLITEYQDKQDASFDADEEDEDDDEDINDRDKTGEVVYSRIFYFLFLHAFVIFGVSPKVSGPLFESYLFIKC